MNLLFAWRYFKAKKSANAINIIAWVTVGVIAFATCCQILVLSVFNGFEGLVKSLYSDFYTDLRIVPARGKTFTADSVQLVKLRLQPGIKSISLVAEENALLQQDDLQKKIRLKGVDKNYSSVSGVPARVKQGKFELGDSDEAFLVVGAGIQNDLEINVSEAIPTSPLVVILPKKNAGIDPAQSLSEGSIQAKGVFSIQQDFDNGYAITNIDFVKQQMGYAPNEYSAIEIKLEKETATETLRKIDADIFKNQTKTRTRYQQNTTLYNTMMMEKWAIYAVLTLILIIAAFNMVSALTMLVLEKQKDISIMQAMGASPLLIQRIFLTEGILLGMLGAGAGIILATLICIIQQKTHWIKLSGSSFLIDYFPVHMQVRDFLLVALTSLLIAFLAAWIPSRRAASQFINLK